MNFSLLLLVGLATIFSIAHSDQPRTIIRPNGGKASRRLIDFYSEKKEVDVNVDIEAVKKFAKPERMRKMHSLLKPNKRNKLRDEWIQERLDAKLKRKAEKQALDRSLFGRHLLKEGLNPMQKPELPEGPFPDDVKNPFSQKRQFKPRGPENKTPPGPKAKPYDRAHGRPHDRPVGVGEEYEPEGKPLKVPGREYKPRGPENKRPEGDKRPGKEYKPKGPENRDPETDKKPPGKEYKPKGPENKKPPGRQYKPKGPENRTPPGDLPSTQTGKDELPAAEPELPAAEPEEYGEEGEVLPERPDGREYGYESGYGKPEGRQYKPKGPESKKPVGREYKPRGPESRSPNAPKKGPLDAPDKQDKRYMGKPELRGDTLRRKHKRRKQRFSAIRRDGFKDVFGQEEEEEVILEPVV